MKRAVDLEVLGTAPRELTRTGEIAQRLNWLRAGVLGANDGIVSVAAVVVGVAGATGGTGAILMAGMAALVGGAVSMALGEYVSVSSQSDSQKHMIAQKRRDLALAPARNLAELARIYERKGLSAGTAQRVAKELTEHDAVGAHVSAELNLDENDVVNAWHAAIASAIAFTLGAILPMLAILLPPETLRVPVTFVAVLAALAITGWVGATIGGGSRIKAALRVTLGGAVALAATFVIGRLLGASGLLG
ncbi:VIT1/CCC1 transporter family protein [Arthrobacter cryoconiti]|uniref:VIT family protein n=1 Tax=Arthrobacter cryoconiti TaxID=748907 RepID=A0ABV8R3B9_9MICC|nr:VIT family protein [Arthrobacter cryoconiti]MCC9067208.1 VIT family protein [Arthrobacter cryoconiti]